MLAQSYSNIELTDSFPLTCADHGELLELVEIRAGGKLRQRLFDLGLTVGMTVRVMQRDTCGPLILAVKNDSRLAVGRGMAQKMMVKPATGGK